MDTVSAPAVVSEAICTTGYGRYWALASIGLGNLVISLDAGIVSSLLPQISVAMHSKLDIMASLSTVCMIASTGLLLMFGWLGDTHGHKRLYLIGFGAMVLSSAFSALMHSFSAFAAFRLVHAAGMSLMFANGPAIITATFFRTEWGRILGALWAVTFLGYAAAPLLGGILAAHPYWWLVCLIHLPLGLLGIYAGLSVIEPDRPAEEPVAFDLPGATFSFAGISALLLALSYGYRWGWGAGKTIGLIMGAIASIAGFIFVEHRRANPLLDLSLFRRPALAGSVFRCAVNFAGSGSITFALSFYFIGRLDLTSGRTAAVFLILPLVMVLSAPVSGSLSDRFGTRGPTLFGFVALATGLLLLSRMVSATTLIELSAGLAIAAVGCGALVAPNSCSLLRAAPHDQQGVASALITGARNLGMVFGSGLAGSMCASAARQINPPAIAASLAGALKGVAAIAFLSAIAVWLERRASEPRASGAPVRKAGGA